MDNLKEEYEKWITMRNQSVDERGEKLCYCGHTYKCECANPDIELFKESMERKTIAIGDDNNGWKKINNNQ